MHRLLLTPDGNRTDGASAAAEFQAYLESFEMIHETQVPIHRFEDWKAGEPRASIRFEVLGKPKGQKDSRKFCKLLLQKADIVATPGIGFGKSGEGFIRMALTVPKERLQEAVDRIRKIL